MNSTQNIQIDTKAPVNMPVGLCSMKQSPSGIDIQLTEHQLP